MKLANKTCVAMCVVSFLASGSVFADPDPDRVSISVGDDVCVLIGDVYPGGFNTVSGDRRQVISANNADGNINYSCSVDLEELDPPVAAPDHTQVYNQDRVREISGRTVQCQVEDAKTDDWHQVTTKSGQSKLTCHF